MFVEILLLVCVVILVCERGFYYYRVSKLTKTNLNDFPTMFQEGFETFSEQVKTSLQSAITSFELPQIDFVAVFENGAVRQSLGNIVMDSIATLMGDKGVKEQIKGYVTDFFTGNVVREVPSPGNNPENVEGVEMNTNQLLAALIAQKGQAWLAEQLERFGGGVLGGPSSPATGGKGKGGVR